MKVEVDFKLFQMLVECIEKQATLADQTPDIQSRWKAIINETYTTANTAVQTFKSQNMISDGRTETGMGGFVSPDKTAYL
jgi:hypothetical protein